MALETRKGETFLGVEHGATWTVPLGYRLPGLVGSPTFSLPCHKVPLLHPWSSTQRDQVEERRTGSGTGLEEALLHWWNWYAGFYWENLSSELWREWREDPRNCFNSVWKPTWKEQIFHSWFHLSWSEGCWGRAACGSQSFSIWSCPEESSERHSKPSAPPPESLTNKHTQISVVVHQKVNCYSADPQETLVE